MADRIATFFAEKTARRMLTLGLFGLLIIAFRHLALMLVFFVTFERGEAKDWLVESFGGGFVGWLCRSNSARLLGSSVAVVDAACGDAVPPSMAVATTTRAKEANSFAGRDSVRPASWPCVSVQLPSPLSMPAESVAPEGTPEIRIDRLSEPSRSTSRAEMASATGLSSTPFAACTDSVGVVAEAAMPIVWSPPSKEARFAFDVSKALNFRPSTTSPAACGGSLMARPWNWASVMVQEPSPLLVPALKRTSCTA
jgi:hypothetical protein